jgi:isoleucyl-tRNA synthetase
LKSRAVIGWDKFEGNTPHKPWIDEIQIKCDKCGELVTRVNDVGNVWLDAGIVPLSTLPDDWFPAHFITESFPGQFKNWFYSMIVMSTVLKKTNPFNTVLGYATVLAEDGRPMHKSWGNYIEFNEGADKIGVDVLRWMYAKQQPADNILFGYRKADETRRQFHLIFWNVYNFFVTYANLDGYTSPFEFPSPKLGEGLGVRYSVLDQWIRARLNQTIEIVTNSLDSFDAFSASHAIEDLVSDMSLWYVRRSRDRVGPTALDNDDKTACHSTLYTLLTTLSKLMAPFMPYMTEEIYKNLTGEESVHLSDWPEFQKINSSDIQLIEEMKLVRKIVEMGLAQRKLANIKVRQPLRQMTVEGLSLSSELEKLILEELNIKRINWTKNKGDLSVILDLNLDSNLIAEGKLRELMRQVQDKRKELGARLDQKINLILPELPVLPELLDQLKRQVLADKITQGPEFEVQLVG